MKGDFQEHQSCGDFGSLHLKNWRWTKTFFSAMKGASRIGVFLAATFLKKWKLLPEKDVLLQSSLSFFLVLHDHLS